MKSKGDKRDRLFCREFWTEVVGFMPDFDTVCLFLQIGFLSASVMFTACYFFFDGNIFALLCAFFILIIVGEFLCYKFFCHEKIQNNKTAQWAKHKKCVTQFNNDTFFLSRYGLLKAESEEKEDETLQSIEESLEPGDTVIIYTPCAESEKEVLKTVKANHERGIIYNVICYNEGNLTRENKELYSKIIKINGKEDNIDYQLSKCLSGFDLFCFKKKSGLIEAYFTVNYSVHAKDYVCRTAADGHCPPENQCYCNNEYLFYKKLDLEIAKALYSHLLDVIENYRTEKVSTT